MAVVLAVGCSIDASKLRSPAQTDARLPEDRPADTRSAPDANDDAFALPDLPNDQAAAAENGDTSSPFDSFPDTAPDGVGDAPVDRWDEAADSPGSDDLILSNDGAVPSIDTRTVDGDKAVDVPLVADGGADSLGDVPADMTDTPVDASADVKDSAVMPDATDAASTCGGAGQICCAGNTCTGGGCCVGGFCAGSGSTCPSPLSGICANGACGNCGGSLDNCCTNATCTAPNTICQTSTFPATTTCTACGGSGDPCCPGNLCLNGGCCIGSISGGNSTCKSAGLQCSPGITSTCSANVCGTCGGLGSPCCANSRCTAPNTFCQTTPTPATCAACGGSGQPCCPNPIAGDSATCSPGFACQSGTGGQTSCVACGGSGQACCAGNVCATGTCKTTSGTCS